MMYNFLPLNMQYLDLLKMKFQNEVLSTVYGKISHKLKSRYGYIISSGNNSGNKSYSYEIAIKINEWIKKYDKHYDSRSFDHRSFLKNVNYIINIDTNTFVHILIGNQQLLIKDINSSSVDSDYESNHISLFIFGKKSTKYKNELEDIINSSLSHLYIFDITQSEKDNRFVSTVSDLKPRPINTLFFEDNIIKKVTSHLDQFLNNKNIYNDRSITFKTGILLYGEPGTGKSSLANAIATYMGYSLVVLDMGNFDKINIAQLTQSINADDNGFVILLEDIDCIFENLDRTDKSKISKDDLKIVNKLLQFTDSNSSPNNVIFVATTNHYERLDEAITRKGRFDLQLEIKRINKDMAIKMCKSFNLSDDDINIVLSEVDFPVNQSVLQEKILKQIKNNSMDKEN